MTLTLIDPTFQAGLRVNLFAPSENQLPKINSIGEILRCHRLKVNENKFNSYFEITLFSKVKYV